MQEFNMFEEMSSWYLVALATIVFYILPVLIIRAGLNRRKHERRIKDRRVRFIHVPIERRENAYDRRRAGRRG